jgi:hypothetical protein
LKAAIARATGLHPHRQGLAVAAQADGAAAAARLDDDARTLAEAGLASGGALREATVTAKDYGPQIGYRAVFLIEYAGPLAIVALYALRPAAVFGAGAGAAPWAPAAVAGVVAWLLHFAKRELETLFVHKFSRPTMPLKQLFVNCAYYWLFALFIGYPLCHPRYTPPASAEQFLAGAALMAASELVNLLVHLQLSGMRPAVRSRRGRLRARGGERRRPLPPSPRAPARPRAGALEEARRARRPALCARVLPQLHGRNPWLGGLCADDADRRRLALHRLGGAADGPVGAGQAQGVPQGRPDVQEARTRGHHPVLAVRMKREGGGRF